jgi:hypothetical protein
MKRPTRITFALLGIAASVGLGSLIVSPWREPLYVCCDTPITLAPVSVCPTPAPKKPLCEGHARFTCEKCGQEYDACSGETSDEELKQVKKHEHLSPKTERN